MKKRLAYAILLLAVLSLAGCATGKSWYYPYGPAYVEDAPGPQTVSEFLSQPRPQ